MPRTEPSRSAALLFGALLASVLLVGGVAGCGAGTSTPIAPDAAPAKLSPGEMDRLLQEKKSTDR